jgi:hypothetical protein
MLNVWWHCVSGIGKFYCRAANSINNNEDGFWRRRFFDQRGNNMKLIEWGGIVELIMVILG